MRCRRSDAVASQPRFSKRLVVVVLLAGGALLLGFQSLQLRALRFGDLLSGGASALPFQRDATGQGQVGPASASLPDDRVPAFGAARGSAAAPTSAVAVPREDRGFFRFGIPREDRAFWRFGMSCTKIFDDTVQQHGTAAALSGSEAAASGVLLVTILGGLPHFRNLTWANRAEYAAQHGYGYLEISSTARRQTPRMRATWTEAAEPLELPRRWDGRGFGWAKVYVLQAVMEQLPWVRHVLWLDADVMITNMLVDVRFLQCLNRSLVVGGDENGVNTGVFMLRNDAWARAWLERAEKIYPSPKPVWYEQPSLFVALHLESVQPNDRVLWSEIFKREYKGAKTQYDANRVMKQLPESAQAAVLIVPQCVMGSRSGTWRAGHFVIHFAGESVLAKTHKMELYAGVVNRKAAHVRHVALLH